MSSDVGRVLVTGGAGFIGSHTVDALLEQGYKVLVLDDLSSGSRSNLRQNKNLRLVRGDVRSKALLRRLVRDVDAVYHFAAKKNIPESVKNPLLYHEVNVTGTLNLLLECLRAKVKRLVLASSSSVYGDTNRPPLRENMPVSPVSPYAASKAAAEAYCCAFNRPGVLETVILRYLNVYGPRQTGGPYGVVMSSFAERINAKKSPIIFGDGEQTRDFVNIKDVVSANILALKAKNASGETINIGTGKPVNINRLSGIFLKTIGKTMQPVYRDRREGDIVSSYASISKALKVLNFSAKVQIEDGVREFLNWYVKSHQ